MPTALIAEDEPLLAQALQQALLRAWPGLQVLAVEDGSTDGSGAILAEYARQGGVTVLHPEQGGSAARAWSRRLFTPMKNCRIIATSR